MCTKFFDNTLKLLYPLSKRTGIWGEEKYDYYTTELDFGDLQFYKFHNKDSGVNNTLDEYRINGLFQRHVHTLNTCLKELNFYILTHLRRRTTCIKLSHY